MLRYLGRYTHRIAISNHRLVSFDGKHVRFPLEGLRPRRQARHHEAQGKRVSAPLLPPRAAKKGFVRIRHYGLLYNCFRKQCLPLAQKLLAAEARYPLPRSAPKDSTEATSLWHCPKCGRPMRVARRFTAAELSQGRDPDSSHEA